MFPCRPFQAGPARESSKASCSRQRDWSKFDNRSGGLRGPPLFLAFWLVCISSAPAPSASSTVRRVPELPLLPLSAAACLQQAGQLRQAEKRAEAAACYRQALRLAPDDLPLCNRVGEAFLALALPEEAVGCYRRLVARLPQLAEAHACLGIALRAQGSFPEAEACQRHALLLQPASASFYGNLGVVLRDQGRFAEAEAAYRRALALDPHHTEARWNLAQLQLQLGNFAEGWRNYEARWQLPCAPCRFAEPLWQGEPLAGRRILLHAEQGLGDNLQFLRFAPLVEARGGRVILGLPPEQHALAAGLVGLRHVEFASSPPQPFDCHSPLMSLPLALETRLESLPASVPYLRVPRAAQERAAALPWPERGLRVGLVWSGRPEHPQNRFRALPLATLQPLFGLEGVHFFSLQMGSPARELEPWRGCIADLAPHTHAMEDTAAQMLALDLILTVDTMTAHLAGALARPVWLLLAANHDPRWMTGRDDSPWYPTMRLFRQSRPGDWPGVVARLRAALRECPHPAARF